MAKGKRKSEPTPGEFRVISVDAYNPGDAVEPPPKVLKYFQQRCHSREELMQQILYYAIKNKYLGIGQFEEFDVWLRVHFVDKNNINYSLSLSFAEIWEIQRLYDDGRVESKGADSLYGNKDCILDWTGPDDDSEAAE